MKRLSDVVGLRPFDAARYIEIKKDILYYLDDAMEETIPSISPARSVMWLARKA